MSMPIQRQSEQFGAFDDGPRWARDRGGRDLPAGIAALVNTSGARIQGGMLNTRTAGWNYPEWDRTEVDYDYDDGRPDAAELAEMEADNERRRRLQPYLRKLDEQYPGDHIPEQFVDPREARRRAPDRPFDRAAACLECGGELTPSQGGFYHTDDEDADEDHEPSPDDDDEVYAEESGQDYDPAEAWDAHKARELDRAYRHGSRRTAALDWRPSGGGPSDDGGEEASPAEGHLVQTHHAYPPGEDDRTSAPVGYGYSIWTYDPEPEDGDLPGWDCVADNGDTVHATHEDAKRAAEEHYHRISQPAETYWADRHGNEYDPGTAEPRCSICGSTDVETGHLDNRGPEPKVVAFTCADPAHEALVNECRLGPDHPTHPNYLHGPFVESVGDLWRMQNAADGWDPDERQDPFDPRIIGAALRRVAQLSYEDAMKYIDDTLAAGEPEMKRDGDGNWVPEPPRRPAHELDEMFGRMMDRVDQMKRDGRIPRDLDDFSDLHDHFDANVGWGEDIDEGLHSDDYIKLQDMVHRRLRETGRDFTGSAPVQDPAAMAPQVPAGGGFVPAHRVGLPWRDRVIKGTVIGLDGDAVAVRWDDGQYSSEEPRNVHLL